MTIAVLFAVGRLLLKPLFRFVGTLDSPELFMAVTLLTIVATATLTHAAGLSAALGAFLAGLLLAESEYRHEIEVNIEPFKGLLLGLFFVSVSMGIDIVGLWSQFDWILVSVVGLFTVKTAITAGLARLFGLPTHVALEMGLLLGQGGEFAFVVVGLALGVGIMPADTAQFLSLIHISEPTRPC